MPSGLERCGTLPSSNAAWDFVNGVPGSGVRVVGSMAGRSLLIAAGIALFTDDREPLKKGAAGASAIELFVLLYALHQKVTGCRR